MTRPVVVVSGSRSLTDPVHVVRAFTWAAQRAGFHSTDHMRTVSWLHGDAAGVDRVVAAHLAGLGVPVEAMPADWQLHGRAAGHVRNEAMVRRAAASGGGALLAVWDGRSKGTAGAVGCAARLGVPVFVEVVGARVQDQLPAELPRT